MKSSIFLTLFFVSVSFVPKTATIPYRQLNWSDFKGKPYGEYAALTASQILYTSDYYDGKRHFTVYSQFLPQESFTTTTKERILKHEQLHFDITELIVRKLNVQLKNVYTEKQALELYYQFVKEWGDLERQYDLETNNSINIGEQQRWEDKIKKLLQ